MIEECFKAIMLAYYKNCLVERLWSLVKAFKNWKSGDDNEKTEAIGLRAFKFSGLRKTEW